MEANKTVAVAMMNTSDEKIYQICTAIFTDSIKIRKAKRVLALSPRQYTLVSSNSSWSEHKRGLRRHLDRTPLDTTDFHSLLILQTSIISR
ncbi:Transposase [Caenorhabditis elegans]|uniref:Transposase n=1 Tax=Caenorhabditis elegans TaxID=6239 RepID=E5QCE2_CAEEL|nr:Transposase [Caenorhabditis elegans]CCD62260.1 Transposase [Caenorhabditis elegans]|eukprot:NP_001257071.1 Uncharacterized protein CELE_B0563.18 [Caenorhabditis elegans]